MSTTARRTSAWPRSWMRARAGECDRASIATTGATGGVHTGSGDGGGAMRRARGGAGRGAGTGMRGGGSERGSSAPGSWGAPPPLLRRTQRRMGTSRKIANRRTCSNVMAQRLTGGGGASGLPAMDSRIDVSACTFFIR